MWRTLTALGIALIVGLATIVSAAILRPERLERNRYRWILRKHTEYEVLIRCDEQTGEAVMVHPSPKAK